MSDAPSLLLIVKCSLLIVDRQVPDPDIAISYRNAMVLQQQRLESVRLVSRESDVGCISFQDVIVLDKDTIQQYRDHGWRYQLSIRSEAGRFPENIIYLPFVRAGVRIGQRGLLFIDTAHHSIDVCRIILGIQYLHLVDALQEDSAVTLHLKRVVRAWLRSLELDVKLAIAKIFFCLDGAGTGNDYDRSVFYFPFRGYRFAIFHGRYPFR